MSKGVGTIKIKCIIQFSLWSAIKMRIAGMNKKKKHKAKKVKVNPAAYRYFIPNIKDR